MPCGDVPIDSILWTPGGPENYFFLKYFQVFQRAYDHRPSPLHPIPDYFPTILQTEN